MDNEKSRLVKIEALGIVFFLVSASLFMIWRFKDLDNLGWDALLDDKYAIAGEVALGCCFACILYVAYCCFRDNWRKEEEIEDEVEFKLYQEEQKKSKTNIFVENKAKTPVEKMEEYWKAIQKSAPSNKITNC